MFERRYVLQTICASIFGAVFSRILNAQGFNQIWVEGDYSPQSQSRSVWLLQQIRSGFAQVHPMLRVEPLNHRGNPDRAIDLYHQARATESKLLIVGGLHVTITDELSKLAQQHRTDYLSFWWPSSVSDAVGVSFRHEDWLRASIAVSPGHSASQWGALLTLGNQGRLVQEQLLKLTASQSEFVLQAIEWRHAGDVEQLFMAYERMRSMGLTDIIVTADHRDFRLFMMRLRQIPVSRAPRVYLNPLPWASVSDYQETMRGLGLAKDWPLWVASQSDQVLHLLQGIEPWFNNPWMKPQTLSHASSPVIMRLWSTL